MKFESVLDALMEMFPIWKYVVVYGYVIEFLLFRWTLYCFILIMYKYIVKDRCVWASKLFKSTSTILLDITINFNSNSPLSMSICSQCGVSKINFLTVHHPLTDLWCIRTWYLVLVRNYLFLNFVAQKHGCLVNC